jgi:hypothetical protein
MRKMSLSTRTLYEYLRKLLGILTGNRERGHLMLLDFGSFSPTVREILCGLELDVLGSCATHELGKLADGFTGEISEKDTHLNGAICDLPINVCD